MNLSDFIDTLVSPPRRLPGQIDNAIEYLAAAMGTPVYLRWTPAALARQYGSMDTAKAKQPKVFELLVDCETVVQFWHLGQLVTAPLNQAPPPRDVVERLLRAQRFRFRPATASPSPTAAPVGSQAKSE